MGSYERSRVTLNPDVGPYPALKYKTITGHFYCDRVSLIYNGHTYGITDPEGGFIAGHVFAGIAEGDNTIPVIEDDTEIYDIAVTPPTLGIDGIENVDCFLVDGTVEDMGYMVFMFPKSYTATMRYNIQNFTNLIIDLELPDIFIMPNTDDDAANIEQCNYIFDLPGIINWVIYERRELETATDSGDGLTFNLAGYDAEPLPEPDVWVGDDEDSLVLQDPDAYEFIHGDQDNAARITFDSSQSGKVVKATYRSKRVLIAREEPYQFEMLAREQLIDTFLDIAGRSKVVTGGGEKAGPRGVTLGWRYQLQEFWDFWREIADNHWRFDIFYAGNQYPDRLITNMFPTAYPNKTHVPQTTPQMVDFAITGMVVE